MDDANLSRRDVLAGLAITGTSGTLVGSGTGALFSDTETFANNSIEASANVAGVLQLEVDVETLEDATGIEYSISLPESVNNNPAYVWIRTKKCPVPPELGDSLRVKLSETCSDGSSTEIVSGILVDVLNGEDPPPDLREGVLICDDSDPATTDPCLQPGEERIVTFEVTNIETGFAPAEGPVEFELEFYGQQCRYDPGATNPFSEIVDKCGADDSTQGKAISFIAFCSEKNTKLNPKITDTTLSDDGPISAEWETKADVDYVIAKSGQNFTIYDLRNVADKKTGTVKTGGDSNADFFGEPSDISFNPSAKPCELAADVEGDGDFPDKGTSIKLDWKEDKFVEETE